MKLSVLICTIPSNFRDPENSILLLNNLTIQAGSKSVEILYLGDNKRLTVGEKRNRLLQICRGEFICFVDDDDWIANDYVDTMLEYANKGKDVHTIGVRYSQVGRPDKMYDYTFKKNINTRRGDKHIAGRIPDHLCLWKKEIAIRVPFPSANLGEDHRWAEAQQIRGYEVAHNNEKIIYHYTFNMQTSQTRGIR